VVIWIHLKALYKERFAGEEHLERRKARIVLEEGH